MKVRMLVQISGVRDGQRWPDVGDIADLTDGAELIDQGLAEAIEVPKVEKRPAPTPKVEKRA